MSCVRVPDFFPIPPLCRPVHENNVIESYGYSFYGKECTVERIFFFKQLKERIGLLHIQIPTCCSCHLGPMVFMSPVGRNGIMITKHLHILVLYSGYFESLTLVYFFLNSLKTGYGVCF